MMIFSIINHIWALLDCSSLHDSASTSFLGRSVHVLHYIYWLVFSVQCKIFTFYLLRFYFWNIYVLILYFRLTIESPKSRKNVFCDPGFFGFFYYGSGFLFYPVLTFKRTICLYTDEISLYLVSCKDKFLKFFEI